MTDIMLLPLVVCLILSVIHAYLGSHIIQRGVIFVDLALAQVAALGATCGVLLGFELHSSQSYFLSLGFALFGAFILAISRTNNKKVPHEAIIGIVYAMAAASSILVLSRAPEGGEELKSLLVGHLLFVGTEEAWYVAKVYTLVGIFLIALHKPLSLISKDHEEAEKQGIKVWVFDFLFYVLFAFVVTSSVELAGVLLVFSLLVVPSVCAAYLADNIRTRLILGWIIGSLTCLIGLFISYLFDLPTGASIVCSFVAPLIVSIAIATLKQRSLPI